jgi:hypothetical protein
MFDNSKNRQERSAMSFPTVATTSFRFPGAERMNIFCAFRFSFPWLIGRTPIFTGTMKLHSKSPVMHDAVSHIQHQFERAVRRYPVQQLSSPGWYCVTFPQAPDLTFTIGLPQTYPRVPPTIQCNNKPLSIPLTDSWLNCFQLEHILGVLWVYAAVAPPRRLTATLNEVSAAIGSASNDSLQDPATRRSLASNLPTVAESKRLAADARESAAVCEAETNRLRQTFTELTQKLAQLQQQSAALARHEKAPPSSRPPSRAVQRHVIELTERANAAGENVRQLAALLEGGMAIDTYVSSVLAARKEQNFHQSLAWMLEHSC